MTKQRSSPYRVRLGVAERRVADDLRAGGKVIYDKVTGWHIHPIDGAPRQVDDQRALSLIAKKVMRGNNDQMFGDVSQTWAFDRGCLR